MISPHELKDKTFQKAVRGYSTVEVDEYFEFLIDKYTELYRENAELEKRLHVLSAKYDELSNDEKSIKAAIVKAQQLSERMIDLAKKEADSTLASVSERCEEMIAETKEKVRAEKEKLVILSQEAENFRESLYTQYLDHIKFIKQLDITRFDKVDDIVISDEEIEKRAIGAEPTPAKNESEEDSDIIAPTSDKKEEE